MNMTDSIREHLEGKQAAFGRWHQEVSQSVQYMAENGHPFAAEFKAHRRFFDSLPYASGPGMRYYSYKDASNFSELIPPHLEVTPNPRPFNGYTRDPNAGNIMMDYLKAAAKADWPEEVMPAFRPGKWRIATTDMQMADALIFVHTDNDHHVQNQTIYFQFDNLDADTFEEVRHIIAFYHGDYVLVPETAGATLMPGLAGFLGVMHHFEQRQDCWI